MGDEGARKIKKSDRLQVAGHVRIFERVFPIDSCQILCYKTVNVCNTNFESLGSAAELPPLAVEGTHYCCRCPCTCRSEPRAKKHAGTAA